MSRHSVYSGHAGVNSEGRSFVASCSLWLSPGLTEVESDGRGDQPSPANCSVSCNVNSAAAPPALEPWKLAVERTHLMAEGVPYLAPVVIDDTTEAVAVVPPEFLKMQWTRLPGALPSPQFVGQIKRLLEAPRRPARPQTVEDGGHGSDRDERRREQPRGNFLKWPIVAVAVAIALTIYFALRPAALETIATASPAETETHDSEPSRSTAANEKSIAVLPFTNMSEEKENAFFTDGMHEDILTNLALIRELRVVSRTTAMQYRDTKKTLREIGRELGVGYILEGSVRRAGNKVRVTGQLIRAATDEHIWAKNYDRDLTDIFAIQSELSLAIAGELKLALSPHEQKLLNRRPTENIAAYDLFLKARDLRNEGGRSAAFFLQEEEWLNRAIQLDPNFAGAWAALAWAHGFQYSFYFDRTEARAALARAAIDHAVQLAADDPGVRLELGYYYYYCLRDYGRAAEVFQNLAPLQPNDAAVYNALASIQRRQGHWLEALRNFRRASQLDPVSRDFALQATAVAVAGRRFDEAMVQQQAWIKRGLGDLSDRRDLADLQFLAHGSTREMEVLLAELNTAQGSAKTADLRKHWAVTLGDYAESVRLDKLQPFTGLEAGSLYPLSIAALDIGVTLAAQGDTSGARARLAGFAAELQARLEREPMNARLLSSFGQIEAVMGHSEAALAHVRKAMELEPESIDAFSGPMHRKRLAFVYAWTGDKERAIAEYARLLKTPYGRINVYQMRKNPAYFPLQGDPRFEALLNDPKNNAPLF